MYLTTTFSPLCINPLRDTKKFTSFFLTQHSRIVENHLLKPKQLLQVCVITVDAGQLYNIKYVTIALFIIKSLKSNNLPQE
jgi:hypothetical protein